MKLSQAIKLNPSKANRQQLFEAVVDLKREYSKSAKAFERHGREPEVLKTVRERMASDPELYDKKMGSMSLNELREVFGTLRDYHAHRTYSEDGRFKGWEENVTRTMGGYQDYLHNVAVDVLGFEQYEKMSQSDQKHIWDIIDKVREMNGDYFRSKGLNPNVAFQSGTNIKEVMSYIKNGVTDPVILFNMLEQHVMEVQQAQVEDDLPSVWDIM